MGQAQRNSRYVGLIQFLGPALRLGGAERCGHSYIIESIADICGVRLKVKTIYGPSAAVYLKTIQKEYIPTKSLHPTYIRAPYKKS